MVVDLAQAMREGMRRLAAGVSVISSRDQDGARYAMTVTSVTSVSDNPPSLLVCVNQSARICPALTVGSHFAVNLLTQAHTDVSIVCSTGDQGDKRFEVGQWLDTPHKTPYLGDAEAVFECQVDLLQTYGTHHIVIGKIVSVFTSDGEINPLVYCDGGYRRLF